MRGPVRLTAALALAALLAMPSPAQADNDPVLGYVFGNFALGYHAGMSAERGSLFGGGPWTTASTLEARGRPFALDGAGFGVGIGYTGLNAQLEVRSAATVGSGLLTIGYRHNLQLQNVELWGRLAAGPAMILHYGSPGVRRDTAGGLVTVGEVGADYFFWKNTLAVGVKAVVLPGYAWPARFTADFDLSLGLRLLL